MSLPSELKFLLLAKSPSFIYIKNFSNNTSRPRDLLQDAKKLIDNSAESSSGPIIRIKLAFVNAIAAFSQRILFDTLLNSFLQQLSIPVEHPIYSTKNDTMDDFLHNIRTLATLPESSSSSKTRLVLVIERAEKLKQTLPRLITPLTKIAELTNTDTKVIFVSDTDWETLTPTSGTVFDPYKINLSSPSEESIIVGICNSFPSSDEEKGLYHPVLKPLFRHFVEHVYGVCSPFLASDADEATEIAYIVAARWPGFVEPVLDEWKQLEISKSNGKLELEEEDIYQAPTEEARIRLIRHFTPSLTNALEALYPRDMSAAEWGWKKASNNITDIDSTNSHNDEVEEAVRSASLEMNLSRTSCFVALAAFLASYNPAKTDYRMFARGADANNRRKRRGGGTRGGRGRGSAIAKIPQRLLGPQAFSLDRLTAILGSLLREYDEKPMSADEEGMDDARAEEDVYHVLTLSSIRDLCSQHILLTNNPTTASSLEKPEKIDGHALMLRCGSAFSAEEARKVARRLGIPLGELLWEGN